MNQELPDVQAGFRKGRGTRDQIANIHWIIEKQGNSRKTSISASLTVLKLCVGHNELWKILQEMGIPDHLTCLLRNRYMSQEAVFKTLNGTTDWFKIGKGVRQVYILSLYLTYMQSTLCEMPGWMNHKLESRLPGEISTTLNM